MFPSIHGSLRPAGSSNGSCERFELNVGCVLEIAFMTDIISGTIGPLIDGAIGSTPTISV
ncbi:hypothetical protein QP735_06535 [Curtobacterium citreum]|uniref:hypothetical protein n=1 Tax=Curtobacterium citreum TaxID=2036 RepID=UPI00254B9E3E|nr:hypothetical protein [Curtobacterium citreum]MDK8172185.1 hypothetical protein [Curtobacterium citreum]